MHAEGVGREYVGRGGRLGHRIAQVAEDSRKHDGGDARRGGSPGVNAGERQQCRRGAQECPGEKGSQGLTDSTVRELEGDHRQQGEHPGKPESGERGAEAQRQAFGEHLADRPAGGERTAQVSAG